MKQVSVNVLKTRRDAKLRRLSEVKPFVQGSLYKRTVKCGNPNCRCAKGDRHESYVLTRKVGGKTKATHVPRDLVEEATAWATEHKRIKKLMKEISDLSEEIIRIHVKTSRAAARNRKLNQSTLQKSSKTSSGTTSRTSSNG